MIYFQILIKYWYSIPSNDIFGFPLFSLDIFHIFFSTVVVFFGVKNVTQCNKTERHVLKSSLKNTKAFEALWQVELNSFSVICWKHILHYCIIHHHHSHSQAGLLLIKFRFYTFNSWLNHHLSLANKKLQTRYIFWQLNSLLSSLILYDTRAKTIH